VPGPASEPSVPTTKPSGGGSTAAWADRALLGLAALVTGFALLQLLLYRYGRDQGIYAVVASTILDGGMPYRDAWDFKPPGVFLVYALARALLGSSQSAVRVVEAGAIVSLLPAFSVLARRFLGDWRPGLVGGAIAVLAHAQLEFWHTAQPESFGGVLTAWALVLSTAEPQSRGPAGFARATWARWAGAGALFGFAALMKPHLGGGAVVAAVLAASTLRRRGASRVALAAPLVATAAGAAAVVLACLGWFAARGALADLRETFLVFAPGYGSTTWDAAYFPNFFYYAFELWAVGLSGPVFVGMLLAVALPRVADREPEILLEVFCVALVHLAGIAVQSKFFPYHYGATLPLGAFVAGVGAWKAWLAALRRREIGVALFLLGAYFVARARTGTRDLGETYWDRCWQRTGAWVRGEPREALDAKLHSVADVDYGANMQVARWLREATLPSDRVYIWGFEPFIYDAAGRKPASRYVYNVPQRVAWAGESARERLMADLERTPPRAIVVEHRDVFPVVTGDSLDSSAALQRFGKLGALLRERYQMRASIEDFDLYLRTGP
jgi:hypothetical protein